MATLESDDSNIIDGQSINLRLVVYPILAAVVIILGGLGYYYNQQYQRDQLEATARAALLKATTPEEFVQVADQYPHTDQATLALLKAAEMSYDKLDYASSIKDYQRIIDTTGVNPLLGDSSGLGLASSLEASGKTDEAIAAYLVVAHRGDKSPYAPFAYNAVSRIYAQRNDLASERRILTEAASLDPDSAFVKQAKAKLQEFSATAPIDIPVSGPAPAKP